ncbi:Tumor necrosis factor-inducible protein6 protein [Holothuria leucospilota]|uniref:Tumor necrosis factor-inducible protein6 protein n=1 Tax=Holothuria leucospilota TaxID=206669 RepID=A0A9Q1BSP0_HOLLE|nr:Tumor necrosis factor-inducible protein6 protein [Holothuria leucospilota]
MAYQCHIKGLSIALLDMLVVFFFHPQAIEGNSLVVLEEPSGVFQSPGYPDLDDDMHCTWKVIAPPNHKITIKFLDFDLVERPICTDKVEIHGGSVGVGPYIRNQLRSQIITSTGNTISVVLISCSTSLLSDRRGIRVSYSTVYPTTLAQKTSNKVATTLTIPPSTKPVESTKIGTFSSPKYPMTSNDGASTPSFLTISTKSLVHLVPAILAGLLVSILIVIIISTAIFKRRKTEHHSNASMATNENNEIRCEQNDLPTVVAEGIAEDNSHLEYDYVQGTSTQNGSNERVILDQNRAIFSTRVNFPKLQKKQPVLNTNEDVCLYEHNERNVYENNDFEEDYGTASCIIEEASPKVGSNGRQLKRQKSDINLDQGLVANSAYEPYVSQTSSLRV